MLNVHINLLINPHRWYSHHQIINLNTSTMSNPKQSILAIILNSGTLLLSTALVGISVDIFRQSDRGGQQIRQVFPPGESWTWYIGSRVVGDDRPKYQITLDYNDTNERMICAASAISIIAGIMVLAGIALSLWVSLPPNHHDYSDQHWRNGDEF